MGRKHRKEGRVCLAWWFEEVVHGVEEAWWLVWQSVWLPAHISEDQDHRERSAST